jgi:histone deacetylase HOS3
MSTATEATTATTATSGTLPVKKTRVSMAPKKEIASRAPRVPKKAAAPKPAGGGDRPGSKAGTASEQAADGLDQITSGMRRIKLVTKAEREARERSKKAPNADNGAAIKRENSDGLPTADDDTITVASGTNPSGPANPMTVETPLPPLPVFSTPAESRFAPVPNSSPMPVSRRPGLRSSSASPVRETQQANAAISTPVRGSATTNGLNDDAADALFVPYEPEGPAPVNVVGAKQALQWLPPNVMETPAQPSKGVANVGSASSTSSATPVKRSEGGNGIKEEGGIRPATPVSSPTPMKRADVPVFTATGAIPFARMGDGVGKEVKGEDNSVWDNPETSAKK